MWQITLGTLRRNARRYISPAIALFVCLAFLTLTLLVRTSMLETARTSLSRGLDNYQAVVEGYPSTGEEEKPDVEAKPMSRSEYLRKADEALADARKRLSNIQGVESVDVRYRASTTMLLEREYVQLFPFPTTGDDVRMKEGRAPTGAAEVALSLNAADGWGAKVGDELPVYNKPIDIGPDATEQDYEKAKLAEKPLMVKVVGIADTRRNPEMFRQSPHILVTSEGMNEIASSRNLDMFLVKFKDPQDKGTFDRIKREFVSTKTFTDVKVVTAEKAINQQMAGLNKALMMLTAGLLLFVALAMITAALVVSNTFSVLTVSRQRQVALTRLLGATISQSRTAVLWEAMALGLITGVLSVALTIAVAVGVLAVASDQIPTPRLAIMPSWEALVVPPIVSTLLCLVAAIAPASKAAKGSVVAGLSETRDRPTVKGRALRIVFGSILLVAGLAGIVAPFLTIPTFPKEGPPAAYIGLIMGALLGCASFFFGLLMLLPLLITPLLRGLGNLLPGKALVPRLAAMQAGQHPKRAAATVTALLIGVTLVTTLSVGATISKRTLNTAIDQLIPIDAVMMVEPDKLPTAVKEVRSVAGIEHVVTVREGKVQIPKLARKNGPRPEGGEAPLSADYSVSETPESAFAIPRMSKMVGDSEAGYLTLPARMLEEWNYDPTSNAAPTSRVLAKNGDKVTVEGPKGKLDLTIRTTAGNDIGSGVSMHYKDFDKIVGGNQASTALVLFNGDYDAEAVWREVNRKMSAVAGASAVPVFTMKLIIDNVINTVLLISLSLVFVAVLIAIVGVGNTLALSVMERKRSLALTRSLGLTKRQTVLVVLNEALLLAGFGVVVGIALGSVFGWAGARALLTAPLQEIKADAPMFGFDPVLLPVMAAVVTLAGALAAIIPATNAAKVPAAQALTSV